MSKVKDSKALSEGFLQMLEAEGEFREFVELVKEQEELYLAFRGNEGVTEAVNIYYKNHTVFKLFCDGIVEVNFNHARYKEGWEKDLLRLVRYGFKKPEISRAKLLMSGVGCVRCKIDDLKKGSVSVIYKEIIMPIMESYFDEGGNARYDYFKNKRVSAKCEVEKERQQQIFVALKNCSNEYFIFDTEFHQGHGGKRIRDLDPEICNNPDMTAIKFNKKKPVALVLVEVKSTESSMFGKTGVLEHIHKVSKCDSAEQKCRLMEAYEILSQYRRLGLYDIPEYKESDFSKVETFENVLIFTDRAKEIWEKPRVWLTNKKQIAEIEEAKGLTEIVKEDFEIGKDVGCIIYRVKDRKFRETPIG